MQVLSSDLSACSEENLSFHWSSSISSLSCPSLVSQLSYRNLTSLRAISSELIWLSRVLLTINNVIKRQNWWKFSGVYKNLVFSWFLLLICVQNSRSMCCNFRFCSAILKLMPNSSWSAFKNEGIIYTSSINILRYFSCAL